MSQIQFRSDDTTKWAEGYGNGQDGVNTETTHTDAPVKTTFSGTGAASTGTVGSNLGLVIGQIVAIFQIREGGTVGTWQLNKITNISGTTITFKYPLVATFASEAILQVVPQYSNYTIPNGVTLTGSAWDTSTGGIVFKMVAGLFTWAGAINLKGKGFSHGGGGQGNNFNGVTGEGTAGAGNQFSGSANGNGAGGGQMNNACGGGGSNVTQGNKGSDIGGTGGAPGNITGNASGTLLCLGGQGGAGDNHTGSGLSGPGQAGGGICVIIAANWSIASTATLTCDGNNGVQGNAGGNPNNQNTGGAGAGGFFLGKGQNFGSFNGAVITANRGVGASSNNGDGGYGGIHFDYGGTLPVGMTGIAPTPDTRFDATLALGNSLFGQL